MTATEETRNQVQDVLKGFWNAYESGDVRFFDYFTTNANVFPAPGVSRIDGLASYRLSFESELQARRRALHVFNLEIRDLGDRSAWATYHCRIRVETVSSDLRVTLVLVKEEAGSFKIDHIHVSHLAQQETPPSAITDDLVEDITSFD